MHLSLSQPKSKKILLNSCRVPWPQLMDFAQTGGWGGEEGGGGPLPGVAGRGGGGLLESVLFIGTQFSNLYTAVDTPGRVCVCVVFVCLVFACKYVLGHSRVSQPLNLRLCLLRHLGFLTSPHASPICRRRRLNSYRLFRRITPDPPPIPWAYPLYLPTSPRPPLYTPTMTT